MWSPKRQEGNTKIVGRAYTVKYALLDDPAPKVANHYVRMFSHVCAVA
jgi:regulator of RNase E activity RraA